MYLGMGNEAAYRAAFKTGKDSPAKFRARCAKYGFTKAAHGTSWDDKCIGHEVANRLGPFAEPKTFVQKHGLILVGAGGLLLFLLLQKGK